MRYRGTKALALARLLATDVGSNTFTLGKSGATYFLEGGIGDETNRRHVRLVSSSQGLKNKIGWQDFVGPQTQRQDFLFF